MVGRLSSSRDTRAACARRIRISRRISDFVALLIFKNSSHREFATGGGANQIDRNVGTGRRT